MSRLTQPAKTAYQGAQPDREQGKTILFVEHILSAVMGVADRIIVMDVGNVIADGEPPSLQD